MLNKLVIVKPKDSDRPLLEHVLPEDGLKQGMYTEMSKSGNISLVRSDGQRFTLAGEYGATAQDLEEFIEPLFQCRGLLYLDETRLLMPISSPRFRDLVHAYLQAPNPFVMTISQDSSFLDEICGYPKVMVWHLNPYVHGLLEERIKEWVHIMMD